MPAKFPGMGSSVPTTTNEKGGKQSASPFRFDLVPHFALAKVAMILKTGADKYGEDNWRKIEIRDNINHAIAHLYAYLAGNIEEDNLGNAACRILFALELELNPNEKEQETTQYIHKLPSSNLDGLNICKECGASDLLHETLRNKFGQSHPVCIYCGKWYNTHKIDNECDTIIIGTRPKWSI